MWRRCFLKIAFLLVSSSNIFAQEDERGGLIPEAIRRPQKDAAGQYAKDIVIGDLGPGEVAETAYKVANSFFESLLTNSDELSFPIKARREEITEKLTGIGVKRYRIAGGREEPDGSVSFLFRYIGTGRDLCGEIYLLRSYMPQTTGMAVQADSGVWSVDDFFLVDRDILVEENGQLSVDYLPYERFY